MATPQSSTGSSLSVPSSIYVEVSRALVWVRTKNKKQTNKQTNKQTQTDRQTNKPNNKLAALVESFVITDVNYVDYLYIALYNVSKRQSTRGTNKRGTDWLLQSDVSVSCLHNICVFHVCGLHDLHGISWLIWLTDQSWAVCSCNVIYNDRRCTAATLPRWASRFAVFQIDLFCVLKISFAFESKSFES